MNSSTFRRFLLWVFLASCFVGVSARAAYSFRHINDIQGLSSNTVKCITEDSYGFMWFGTNNGLCRYDGLGMRRLSVRDPRQHKENNNIGALYEAPDKRLWVGTDRGVYLYDPRTDQFSFINRTDPRNPTACDNWVQTIDGDRAGNVWALLPDVGVFHFMASGKTEFFHVTSRGNYKENEPIDLCVTHDGEVWVCSTNEGIYKYNRRLHHFDQISKLGDTSLLGIPFLSIREDASGHLLLATKQGKIYRFHPHHLDTPAEQVPFSAAGRVYANCLQCFGNEVWLGTRHGLYVINTENGQESFILNNVQDNFSLSDNDVMCVFRTHREDAWLGTLHGGASFVPLNKFCFLKYGASTGLEGTIRGMAWDADGMLWVGSDGHGIRRFNPQTQAFTRLTTLPPSCSIVYTLTADGNNICGGFARNGMKVMSADGCIVSAFTPEEGENSIYSYLKDSHGNEWFGLGYALYCKKVGEEQISRVARTGFDWIFCIEETNDGNIWFGTMGNGLWRLTTANGKFTRYTCDESRDNGLRSNSINSLMEDSHGNLWISTDRGGLSRYDKSNDRFTTWGTKEGLPDDMVYDVLEDEDGNLWFGTNRGLVKFAPEKGTIETFTRTDGLPCNQFTCNAAAKGQDGLFYFGTQEGLVAFDPIKQTKQQSDAHIYFTQLHIGNTTVEAGDEGSPLKENIIFADHLSLPYNVGTFSIDVAAPDFGVAGNQHYTYNIKEFGAEWTEVIGGRLTFSNLSPGTYHLQVQVEACGHTSRKSLTITITPPWWRSPIANSVYLLLVAAAIAAWFTWYRNYKTRQAEQRLYKDKVDFFTEIAHEIRTPLTLIDAPLEAIEEIGLRDEAASKYLQTIKKNTKRLLSLVAQLLEFQRMGARRTTLQKESISVRTLVVSVLDDFEMAFLQMQKTLRRNICEQEVMAATDKDAVTKILDNLTANALKYAREDVRVTLTADDSHFTISVWSDGDPIQGREAIRIFEPFYQMGQTPCGERGIGMGLPISRQLAISLGGSLTLNGEKDPNGGNTFVATLPLNKTDLHSGTDELTSHTTSMKVAETDWSQRSDANGMVLIVEDNDDMRQFLATQVSQVFNVVTAQDGKEALQQLGKHDIDLIVSDIMMPEMDGFELCREVKANLRLSHIPFVFITAKNDIDSKVEGTRLGAEGYIEKPFDIKYFRELIHSLIDNRRREREAFAKKPFFGIPDMHVNKGDEAFMEQAKLLIEAHLKDDDFNVEQMASHFCMSHSSLLRKVKAVFNCLPTELIRIVRLKKSAELIASGQYKINEIAYMVGFSAPSYFSKMFFKQFGVTPKEFEKQLTQRKQADTPET